MLESHSAGLTGNFTLGVTVGIFLPWGRAKVLGSFIEIKQRGGRVMSHGSTVHWLMLRPPIVPAHQAYSSSAWSTKIFGEAGGFGSFV